MKQWLKWVTVAAALALTACGGSKPAEDQAAQGTQPAAEKTYKVGVNAAFAPFESVDSSGKMQGFDIELAQAVADAAGIKRDITPHTLRHSFAVHMLQNGADIKSVQEMLGHSDISSTQMYLGLDTVKMRDVYMKAHPRS